MRPAPKVLAYYDSSRSGEKPHEIRQSMQDGSIYCTCKGWIFSNTNPKTCRHLAHWNAINQVPGAAIYSRVAHVC